MKLSDLKVGDVYCEQEFCSQFTTQVKHTVKKISRNKLTYTILAVSNWGKTFSSKKTKLYQVVYPFKLQKDE